MTVTITLTGVLTFIGLLAVIAAVAWLAYGFTVLTFIGEPDAWWLVVYGVIMLLCVAFVAWLVWAVLM